MARLLSVVVCLSVCLGSCVGAGSPWVAAVALLLGAALWARAARAEGLPDAEPDVPPAIDAAMADGPDGADAALDGGDAGRPPPDPPVGPCLSPPPGDAYVGPCLSPEPEVDACLCAMTTDEHDDPVDLPILIGAGLVLAGRPRRRQADRAELTERVLDRAALPADLARRIRDDQDYKKS